MEEHIKQTEDRLSAATSFHSGRNKRNYKDTGKAVTIEDSPGNCVSLALSDNANL